LAHLTFYFFHLARPQKSLPIPGLHDQRYGGSTHLWNVSLL